MTENLIIAILGGGNLLLFIKFLIERADAKKDKNEAKELEVIKTDIEGIKKEVTLLKKDGIRTQLLLLILMQPDEKTEILTIAEHYFKKPNEGGLGGNWYMTGLFAKWCKQHNLSPDWFDA